MRALQSVLIVAAAAAFGLLTWGTAHALTYAVFADTHGGLSGYTHFHGGVGPIIVTMLAFVATAVACSTKRGPRSWASRVWPGPLAAVSAHAAFVVVESVEHLAVADGGPPAALLVIGVVVHTAMGVATPLLWNGLVRYVILALQTSAPPILDSDDQVAAQAPDEEWAASRPPSRITNRGPPTRGLFHLQLVS